MTPLEFTKQIKILSLSYNKDFDEDVVIIWYEYFKDTKKEILETSLKNIIKKSKYMPSISEIIEECKKTKKNIRYSILEKMQQNKYFKTSIEYEKAIKWLEAEIIPSWFKEDMKKYYNLLIENKNQKMIGE